MLVNSAFNLKFQGKSKTLEKNCIFDLTPIVTHEMQSNLKFYTSNACYFCRSSRVSTFAKLWHEKIIKVTLLRVKYEEKDNERGFNLMKS